MTFPQGITPVLTAIRDTRILTRIKAGALAMKYLGWIHEACLLALKLLRSWSKSKVISKAVSFTGGIS